MKKKYTVIIGQGPIGLLLAYLLDKKGVQNLLVLDPRSGEYLRPGHLNRDCFDRLEMILGERVFSDQFGHIKDFERILFDKLSTLDQISIEKKRFLGFTNDSGTKGILVEDLEGTQQTIHCDIVFDCTGSKQALVKKINSLVNPPPFTTKSIVMHVPIKQHLIAYVRMSKEDYASIPWLEEQNTSTFFPDAEHYVHSINQMRGLGWKDFGLPQLYGKYFGKDKVCLYVECPDKLPPSQHEEWLNLVLSITTQKKDITYQRLESQKKPKKNKLRFDSYEVDPHKVEEAAFTSRLYPTIIPIGDSQIQPHPILSHGLWHAMPRVYELVEQTQVSAGLITYIDIPEYQCFMEASLEEQENEIKLQFIKRKEYSVKMLFLAQTHYTTILSTLEDSPEKQDVTSILIEIKALISYNKALKLKEALVYKGRTLSLANYIEQLSQLSKLHIEAYEDLPPDYSLEKKYLLDELKQNAVDLMSCSNRTCDNSVVLCALEATLTIYSHPLMALFKNAANTIQSEIVYLARILNDFDKSITQGCLTLVELPDIEPYCELRKELLFNVLKAIEQKNMKINDPQDIQLAVKLLKKYPQLLNEADYNYFYDFFDNLKTALQLPTYTSPRTSLSRYSSFDASQAINVPCSIERSDAPHCAT